MVASEAFDDRNLAVAREMIDDGRTQSVAVTQLRIKLNLSLSEAEDLYESAMTLEEPLTAEDSRRLQRSYLAAAAVAIPIASTAIVIGLAREASFPLWFGILIAAFGTGSLLNGLSMVFSEHEGVSRALKSSTYLLIPGLLVVVLLLR